MKKLFILYILSIFSFSLQAQSLSEYRGMVNANRITLQDSNRHKLVFYVKEYHKKAKDIDIYHWYTSGSLQQSQGAYSGKVLDGSFEQFYPNKNLALKGQFDNGLKQGEWKEWSVSGLPTKMSNWKRGHETGDYRLFDDKGLLKEQGQYINGHRNGKIRLYDPVTGGQTYQHYRHGISIPKDDYIRQNIFRRSGNYLGEKWKTWFGKKSKEA